ncbi:hypothetical protein OS493_025856 [Desmophyllum pertusum]|uniref:Uncharacterized protein n=1 Tax=Desmophyllum pertusum TaxID=174260 RepID=A0A9W9Z185_9CNID|nr:hypothetical protein OS493_025856 [Desmophyllum pertusum]
MRVLFISDSLVSDYEGFKATFTAEDKTRISKTLLILIIVTVAVFIAVICLCVVYRKEEEEAKKRKGGQNSNDGTHDLCTPPFPSGTSCSGLCSGTH